jgi:hypothetical protein
MLLAGQSTVDAKQRIHAADENNIIPSCIEPAVNAALNAAHWQQWRVEHRTPRVIL